MQNLITHSGVRFEVYFAGPSSITEDIVFWIKILNSDIDSVHNTFKLPEETDILTLVISDEISERVLETYTGYTRYCGFSVDNDGSILVQLKKNIGA